jgi:hypothetical protein
MFEYFITTKVIGAIVRHGIGAVGAFFVASGIVDPVADSVQLEAIAGGAVALAALALSVW